jgi:hypothetical protein
MPRASRTAGAEDKSVAQNCNGLGESDTKVHDGKVVAISSSYSTTACLQASTLKMRLLLSLRLQVLTASLESYVLLPSADVSVRVC